MASAFINDHNLFTRAAKQKKTFDCKCHEAWEFVSQLFATTRMRIFTSIYSYLQPDGMLVSDNRVVRTPYIIFLL